MLTVYASVYTIWLQRIEHEAEAKRSQGKSAQWEEEPEIRYPGSGRLVFGASLGTTAAEKRVHFDPAGFRRHTVVSVKGKGIPDKD